MLKATERILKTKIGDIDLLDQGEAEALRTLRIKACRRLPTSAKPGQTTRSRIIFAFEGFISYKWKKLPEEGRLTLAPLEETLRTVGWAQHKTRIRIQVLVRHAVVLCGAEAPPGRAPRGNLVRQLSKTIVPEKGGKGALQLSQTMDQTSCAPSRKDCREDGEAGDKVSPNPQEASGNQR